MNYLTGFFKLNLTEKTFVGSFLILLIPIQNKTQTPRLCQLDLYINALILTLGEQAFTMALRRLLPAHEGTFSHLIDS